MYYGTELRAKGPAASITVGISGEGHKQLYQNGRVTILCDVVAHHQFRLAHVRHHNLNKTRQHKWHHNVDCHNHRIAKQNQIAWRHNRNQNDTTVMSQLLNLNHHNPIAQSKYDVTITIWRHNQSMTSQSDQDVTIISWTPTMQRFTRPTITIE